MWECDVGLTYAPHCDWSALNWAEQKDGGAWLGGQVAEGLGIRVAD